MQSVMIVGLGEVGGHLLEFLARTGWQGKMIVSDVREDWLMKKSNSVMLGSLNQGFRPNIVPMRVDLNDIEATARIIEENHPDLVFNATSLQSWWVIGELPPQVSGKLLEAGLGAWLPMHLTLAYKLMQAVKKSSVQAQVVNSAFPDAVNPTLARAGLAPTVGIGNLDLLIPKIRLYVSQKLAIPIDSITVYMVGHHFHLVSLLHNKSTSGAPYFLKVMAGDKDVTKELGPDRILSDAGSIPVPEGAQRTQQTASSSLKIIMAILNNKGEFAHPPGPNGLVGSYPSFVGGSGAKLALPTELTLQDAISINEQAQKFDGIEEIRDGGTVILTEKTHDIMKEMLGYECKVLKVAEAEERAKELGTLYAALRNKCKK